MFDFKNYYFKLKRKIKRFLISYSRVILVLKSWLFSIAALALGFYFIYPQLVENQKLFDISLSSDAFSDGNSIKINNIKFFSINNDNKPLNITALSAEESNGDGVVILEKPIADIVAENNETFIITSEKGSVDKNTKNLSLFNNVNVSSSSGYVLKSEKINFNVDDNSVSSNQKVFINSDMGNLTAESFKTSDNGNKIYFNGNTLINIFER